MFINDYNNMIIYIYIYIYIYICSKIKVKYWHKLIEKLASFSHVIPETYLEPSRTSMMELFCKNQ